MNRADAGAQAIFTKAQGHCHFCGDKSRLGLCGKPDAWVRIRPRERKQAGVRKA
ncbi:MAG: hypothetical protein JSU73_09045 [candidate division WOR-3 bacterium]|nr:MAG: hypothetical protein JSU73_09045 [candidate division WOR-3 bacterium]